MLETFGISYGALRVAGGLTVAVIGHRMLFGTVDAPAPGMRGSTDIAFFPLAMPGIAGPGAIATVIGISTEIAELPSGGVRHRLCGDSGQHLRHLPVDVRRLPLRAAGLALAGSAGVNVVTRLTGFLLVCIGIQFIGSGIEASSPVPDGKTFSHHRYCTTLQTHRDKHPS